MTKALGTGALEASVGWFDSSLLDNNSGFRLIDKAPSIGGGVMTVRFCLLAQNLHEKTDVLLIMNVFINKIK